MTSFESQTAELAHYFDTLYGEDSGFTYLCDLENYVESFRWPLQRDEMIEAASWALESRLYTSPWLFDNGQIRRYKDENGRKRIETGRLKENAKTSRTIFLDADAAQPGHMRIEPSIKVQSSPGRWHLYWELDRAYSRDEVLEVVALIARVHAIQGADLSSANGAKLLLVPFSKNTKKDKKTGDFVHPDKPRVTAEYTGLVYSLQDIRDAYPEASEPKRTVTAPVFSDEAVPDLLAFDEIYSRLPLMSSTGKNFNDLVFKEPWKDATGNFKARTEMRMLLACELAREGLTAQEILTVCWQAKCFDKWRDDKTGLGDADRGPWHEALLGYNTVQQEMGVGNLAPVILTLPRTGTSLLSPEERELVPFSIIDEYQDWAKSRLTLANLPYHRGNIWSGLSAAFADRIVIPFESGFVHPNMWVMEVGETGSGKGDAKKMFQDELLDAIVPEGFDNGINIGADAHKNALLEVLIARDGRVSMLQTDEAHGVFRVIRDQSWTSGTLQVWTDLFDGKVPVVQKVGKKDISGKAAKTIFLVWFMGTRGGMSEVLTRDMFESGFLPRFIWYVGDPAIDSDEAMIPKRMSQDTIDRGIDPKIKEWKLRFNELRSKLGPKKVIIDESEEALERLGRATIDLKKSIGDGRHEAVMKEALRRIQMHMRKAAALIAVSRGSKVVELGDVLIAIQACEEWWDNLETMAGEISSSKFAHDQDAIIGFIKNSGGYVAKETLAHRFRDITKGERDTLLSSLTEQGEIKAAKVDGKTVWQINT